MRLSVLALVAGFSLLGPVTSAHAQEAAATQEADPIAELPWVTGPTDGSFGKRAAIDLPEGYAFLGADGTRRFNELNENPPSGLDEYVVAPLDLSWVAYFTFSEVGYVKDDEKLDADEILSSVREGTEHGNETRRERGWDTLNVLGWSFQPQYDKQLNSLEWAILLETEATKSKVVNYNTRLLGRRGVMEVTLVAAPETLDASIADFKRLMPGYAFGSGEKYAEYKPGDHVAEYGLAALITGGAAAVAAKKGWLAAIGVALVKFWKLLLIGLVAVGAGARKLFKRRQADGAEL
jgi:uncharacterized membrane-anchored protein